MKYSCFFLVKILISTQILTSIYSKKTGDKCEVQRIFNDVTILGGIKAGLYIPYEGPEGLADMTATKCTVFCCKKNGVVDIVFLINKYCYCISCYSSSLCRPVPIKPPRGFSPVAIVLNKDILDGTSFNSRTTNPTKRTTGQSQSTVPSTPLPITTSHVWYGSTRLGRTSWWQGGGWKTQLPKVTIPRTPIPTTLRKTLAPTRLAQKDLTAEGTGNDDITLQCAGTMTVTRVLAFGITGDQQAVIAFNKYCRTNTKKIDSTNICLVSLKRVYKSQYPPFIKTKVNYTCKYFTRDPA